MLSVVHLLQFFFFLVKPPVPSTKDTDSYFALVYFLVLEVTMAMLITACAQLALSFSLSSVSNLSLTHCGVSRLFFQVRQNSLANTFIPRKNGQRLVHYLWNILSSLNFNNTLIFASPAGSGKFGALESDLFPSLLSFSLCSSFSADKAA